MKKRRITIFGLIALILYCIGYIGARKIEFIVHSVVRDHSDHYLEHSVKAGEGKFIGGTIKNVVSIIYTPLRTIEMRYWYSKQPVGMPLTQEHLDNLVQ